MFLLACELGSNYELNFSYSGVVKLIKVFSPLDDIATACFALITAFLVVIQVELSAEANIFNTKSSWIEKLMTEIKYLETDNSAMHSFFRVNGDELFDYLYTINMRFGSKEQLDHFFDQYFSSKTKSFEEGAKDYDIDKYNDENNKVTSFSNNQMDSLKDFLLRHSSEYPSKSNIKKDFNDRYNKAVGEYKKTLEHR